MSATLFKEVNYSLSKLVAGIDTRKGCLRDFGEIFGSEFGVRAK